MTRESVPECLAYAYELRFGALSSGHRPVAFPCDEVGRIDLDALDPRSLNDYLFARVAIGREYATPIVQPAPADA